MSPNVPKNVSAIYTKSRDDIDRYERTAKESAESDYQRLLKVHMATKEILKWRERELRKERERQENAQREWQRVLRR